MSSVTCRLNIETRISHGHNVTTQYESCVAFLTLRKWNGNTWGQAKPSRWDFSNYLEGLTQLLRI